MLANLHQFALHAGNSHLHNPHQFALHACYSYLDSHFITVRVTTMHVTRIRPNRIVSLDFISLRACRPNIRCRPIGLSSWLATADLRHHSIHILNQDDFLWNIPSKSLNSIKVQCITIIVSWCCTSVWCIVIHIKLVGTVLSISYDKLIHLKLVALMECITTQIRWDSIRA
jgi:hypothetical protein